MKKCYLHIGNFKTGSSSLQAFLYQNRKIFRKHSIEPVYEKNFFKKTINNLKLFKNFNDQDQNKLREKFKKYKKFKNIIISSEYFSCMSNDEYKIIFLKKFLKKSGFKPIIIFYYRDDDDYLYSFYSEQLKQRKNIEIENVFKFLEKIYKFGYYFNKKNKIYYLSQKYFFDKKIIFKTWKKIFKSDFKYYKYYKEDDKRIYFNFLSFVNIKGKEKFNFPIKRNISRKIRPWNLMRIGLYLFLKFHSKKLLNR